MKKLIASILALCLALCCAAALAETTDTVSSASKADFYGSAALTGDALKDAINSQSGTYLISTVNPDGTPNCGYFIFACVEHEGKFYIQLGLAENQSRENLLRTGDAVAVYAANPSTEEGAKAYTISGARMTLKVVTDEALLSALNTKGSATVIFAEVTAVRPLG